MNFQPSSQYAPYGYTVPAQASSDASRALRKKWDEEVLPHMKQAATNLVGGPRALGELVNDLDVELASPTFTSPGLTALAARGFVRKNSWR